jgi:cell division protein FtsQ
MPKAGSHIRKLLRAILWLTASILVVLALVAAIRRSNEASCTGGNIKITGAGKLVFLEKADIWQLIGVSNGKSLKGKAVAQFELRMMEEKIRKNSWVNTAELFFDQEKILQVRITEREPIARIFTGTGNSFYLDSTGKYLPLSPGKPPVKLPVITGMPESIRVVRPGDSALLAAIRGITQVLNSDSFWMAQIVQVNRNSNNSFDMVPLIGQHIIQFGDGTNCEKKFKRLALFYQKVLRKTGFDYYQAINVQFDKQVVGIKGPAISTHVDKKIVWGSFADTSLMVKASVKRDN